MTKSSPHLGLRRKASATFDLLEADADHHREMLGCLKTLLHQGEAYRCGDYLRNRSPSMVEFKKSSKDSSLDENCREKMCEWGYKVCDHFRIPREIVAFAFSYLDRFEPVKLRAGVRLFLLGSLRGAMWMRSDCL